MMVTWYCSCEYARTNNTWSESILSKYVFAGDDVLKYEFLPVNVVSYNHHLPWNVVLYVILFKKLEKGLHANLVGMDDLLRIQLPLLTYHNLKFE